jgi:hypothetical protein
MASMLFSNRDAAIAVDEWILTFPSMTEFSSQRAHTWFRPFIETVANHKLQTSSWGLRFRVSFGAAISMLDMGSDLAMTQKFFATGEVTLAWTHAAMLAFNVCFLQLFIVYVRKRTKGSAPPPELIPLTPANLLAVTWPGRSGPSR